MADAVGPGVATGDPVRTRTALGLWFTVALGIVVFTGLGVWQLERRIEKLALIARVEARIHAAAVDAPGPNEWSQINAAADEYRHVHVVGRLQNDRETLVLAVTDEGPGYWVLTPLLTSRGFTVLVNRGFVPSQYRDRASRLAGELSGDVDITGLLRMSEPHGAFLRSNDPAAERWYSRDVAAIAARRELGPTAPYFIDADATPNPGGWPLGGLTVVRFANNHLVYALTWFALALGLAGFGVMAMRGKFKSDEASRDAT